MLDMSTYAHMGGGPGYFSARTHLPACELQNKRNGLTHTPNFSPITHPIMLGYYGDSQLLNTPPFASCDPRGLL